MKSVLVLENGSVYEGLSFGSEQKGLGEVCFNTSMAGYQEILTDPSYLKQIVTLTYPMIGNYGIAAEYAQSNRIQASGLLVKQYVRRPSNYKSEMTLGDYLKKEGIPALQGFDTRKLTLEIRRQGAMRGGIFPNQSFSPTLLEEVRSLPKMDGLDLASIASTKEKYSFGSQTGKKYRIAVFDFGVKKHILELLDQAGFAVDVFPAKTNPAELNDYHSYFLSNGPGDPEPLTYAIESAQKLIASHKPIFGICLGHQVLGLADGRKTYKLKFGHRGGNQPVKVFADGKVEITAQNHGFAVEEGSGGMQVSHINLNDQTIEGFLDKERNILSVQYHPEASPGPNDAAHLFGDFYTMVEQYYSKG